MADLASVVEGMGNALEAETRGERSEEMLQEALVGEGFGYIAKGVRGAFAGSASWGGTLQVSQSHPLLCGLAMACTPAHKATKYISQCEYRPESQLCAYVQHA